MRKKMPNRRPAMTTTIEFEQQKLYGTIGYDPKTGLPREAFFSTRAKSGTLLVGLFYDAGVLLSLALQFGTPATALAKSVARLEDGKPASPVGELIGVIVKEVEASNQSNSQRHSGRRHSGRGRSGQRRGEGVIHGLDQGPLSRCNIRRRPGFL